MKENVKAIVVGAAGKMGGRIIHIVRETPSIELYRALERSDHPSIGRDIGELIGLGKLGIPLEGGLKKEGGDVIINFSNPTASLESLEFARETGSPLSSAQQVLARNRQKSSEGFQKASVVSLLPI